jgi:TetR/AcrR family transcriptional regulator, lmrAB and yxaGH operons repressor
VGSTIQLLRRQGLHGTGLQDVLAHSGAPRGSLYFHFPGGKEELIREALADATGVVDRWLSESLDRHPTVAEGMDDFLGRYGDQMARAAYSEGCPVAAVALDVGPESDRLRIACDWAMTGWVATVAERLRSEGRDAETAESLALTAVAALEGALILCRARRSLEPLGAVATHLQTLLQRPVSSHGDQLTYEARRDQ